MSKDETRNAVPYSPFSDSETKEISASWWDGLTVTIKKFTYGQHLDINSSFIKVGASITGKMDTDIKMDEMELMTCLQGIVKWDFIDVGGTVVPVTLDSIKKLNPDDGNYIYSQINEFNKSHRVSREELEQAKKLHDEEMAKGQNADQDMLGYLKDNLEDLEARWEEQSKKFREAG